MDECHLVNADRPWDGLVWYLKPEIWKMEGAGEGGTVYGLLTCWYRL
jgi:hypothetical protein